MERKSKSKDYYDPNIKTDPFGSYTGVADERNEKPVQDADDL